MKFKYNGSLPIIPVVFCYRDRKIGYFALLDTGADICIVHAEFGKALGIDVTSGKKSTIHGITGPGTVYTHEVDIEIGGWLLSGIPVSFSYDMSPDQSFGILGHKGFFEYCKAIFDTSSKEVDIRFSTN